MRASLSVFALAIAAVLSSPDARAQLGASTGTGNNLDIEHYAPAMLGLATVDRSANLRWREYSIGLYAHYVRNPLVLFADRLQVGEVVAHRVSMDLAGTIGLLSWLDASIAIPLTFYQSGDPDLPTGALSAAGLRDLRLSMKAAVSQATTGFLGLAFVPEVTIPVGSTDAFLGDGNVTFTPQLVVDRTIDVAWGMRAALAAGVRIRPRSEIGNITVDDELVYRVGLGVGLPNFLDAHPEAIAELSGTGGLADFFAKREQNALEGTLAMRASFEVDDAHRLGTIAGVTIGATRGYGAPDFQVFTGVTYSKQLTDRDGDGIWDDEDLCPDDPEDRDGFEDSDGCPEADNDRDGIPDTADKCPDDPEDKDRFEDLDGCPEPDNDRDGILDRDDKCPLDPEDLDGFQDDDGCPEPDNDRDGIPDEKDKCPTEKEVINGVDDEDGCPDEGAVNVEVTSEKVTINEKIMFEYDSAIIQQVSYSILNQVALVLLANPQLKKVRVEGHTDERGSDDYNLELSQRRSESVAEYLVKRGVNANRLEAVGYGEQRPVDPAKNEEAYAKNRRVEFTILDKGDDIDQGTRTIEIPVEPEGE
ncbi:OmpA family protein [Myxococcota bacterium]|nr:OmpA family protein [Myxococcota bacterium]